MQGGGRGKGRPRPSLNPLLIGPRSLALPVDRSPSPLIIARVNYRESLDWLYSTQTFGIKLGLDSARHLMASLGVNPDQPGPSILHVAGTNGKGSVCAMSERILRDAGIKTGLFTSPHLVTFRERIRVNGGLIEEGEVAAGLSQLRQIAEGCDPHPTFFEITLALAMDHFVRSACEVVVLETGMGGRLDATNALQSTLCVISSVALDHQQWLGESLREIAAEKAGILKPGVPVIIGELPPEAREVVGRRALQLGIPCLEAHPLPPDWKLGLRGPHQRENAALAVEAVCRLEEHRLRLEGIQASLASTDWPGRFQILDPQLVLDGAHNPAAAAALRQTWEQEYPGEKAHLIFGAVESKDVVGLLAELRPILASIDFVAVNSERGLSLDKMQQALREAGGAELPRSDSPTLSEAMTKARARGGRCLLTGSLFLVGEALSLQGGPSFESSLQ